MSLSRVAAARSVDITAIMEAYRLHYAPDNASLIIRLALDARGLSYDTVLVDRQVNAQRSQAYRALNPNGLIPVLETPQGPIFETGAILLWLADTHGGLGPSQDAPDRAAFLKWLFFVANTLHPALRMIFYPQKYVGPDPRAHAQLHQTVTQNLGTHLSHLDQLAATQPGWFGAQDPSVMDFYVACCLRWCALYPAQTDRSWFTLAQTPHLHDICAHLQTLPCCDAAQRAEGLGPTPFTNPNYATPPEGSAV